MTSSAIDALAGAVVNRLLHHPTARMKELNDDRVHQRMALVRDLFDLSVDEPAVSERPAGDEHADEPTTARVAEVRSIGTRRR